jgi:hypothetical protein
MRRAIPLALAAAVLVAPAAFAQSPNHENGAAGQPGMPGNKSGPAVTPSGQTQGTNNNMSQDASKVPGLPGNKSGPAAQAPNKQ